LAQAERPGRQPATPTVAVALGLSLNLLSAAGARYEARTGKPATAREVISYAVGERLPGLVEELRRLGFRGGRIGKRRPRRIKRADWSALQAASDASGLPASTLLRACLQQIKDYPTH
jgi:hypothetical protein